MIEHYKIARGVIMLMVLLVAKFLDLIGFIIAGAIVLFFKSKWGIVISGAITSIATIFIIQATGRSLPPDIIVSAFLAGVIAHSIHAGIVYYIKQLFTKKKTKSEI